MNGWFFSTKIHDKSEILLNLTMDDCFNYITKYPKKVLVLNTYREKDKFVSSYDKIIFVVHKCIIADNESWIHCF
jgi:hypothetical protein